MAESATTIVTIPAIEADLDLTWVRKYRDGVDGRLLAISYQHTSYFPGLSGPVLHYQLPNGRVVLTWPDPDGHQFIYEDSQEPAQDLDEGAYEVLHGMWDDVRDSFQSVLLKAFGDAAVKAMLTAVSTN
ncbi:hypothetical protein [Amycolatopsis anabasis]|uniref:hypothetical protein n=1 Tax=Amycolatopsis anabasis TaxID=1840409 RepID=UPI00131C0A35|nr:hypothetical protein [Amycolatopsis anabasis]